MEKKEFALLDADFIIKAIISREAEDNCLLDYLASNTKYQLVCHEMALKEVSIHDYYGASDGLNRAIKTGIIKQFTDKDIICELYDLSAPPPQFVRTSPRIKHNNFIIVDANTSIGFLVALPHCVHLCIILDTNLR